MAGAGDVEHVEVVLLDDPVQMDIDEVLAGRGAPMSQQARFDVVQFQRLAQHRIPAQINLPHTQIISRAPVGVHLAQFFRG